jgi:hypothetical protein
MTTIELYRIGPMKVLVICAVCGVVRDSATWANAQRYADHHETTATHALAVYQEVMT